MLGILKLSVDTSNQMVIPKNRIRLSRSLRSQVTPYPNANKIVKRAVLFAAVALIGGFYFFLKEKPETKTDTLPKQILGEQEQAAPKPQFDLYKVKKRFILILRSNITFTG